MNEIEFRNILKHEYILDLSLSLANSATPTTSPSTATSKPITSKFSTTPRL